MAIVTRPLILPALRRTAADAERFARAVHEGQVDKAGRPYVEHLERVAAGARAHAITASIGMASQGADEIMQIAWLHDVIEDTDYTAGDLRNEWFSLTVVEGVNALTKRGSAPYAAWIEHLCTTATLPVLIVKLADIEDNSDPARLAVLDEATRTRLGKKYGPARDRLRAAIGGGHHART